MVVPGWGAVVKPRCSLCSLGWHEAPGAKASRVLQLCEALLPAVKSKTWKTAGIWFRGQEAFLNECPKGVVGAGGTEGPIFNPCPPARDPTRTGHPWKSLTRTFPHRFSWLQEHGVAQPPSAPLQEGGLSGAQPARPAVHRPTPGTPVTFGPCHVCVQGSAVPQGGEAMRDTA